MTQQSLERVVELPMSDETVFRGAWDKAWCQAREDCRGAPNLSATAGRLYTSLFSNGQCNPPNLEEFTNETIAAVTQLHIFKDALYNEAPKLVNTLSDKGPLAVWTAGDMHGSTGLQGQKYPGSKEQLIKVVSSGLFGEKPTNIFAAEDKVPLLPKVFDWLIQRGAEKFAVFDDKKCKLEAALAFVRRAGLVESTHIIWVRQGMHGDTGQPTPEGMHSLEHISLITPLLGRLGIKGRLGVALDFDGVVSDTVRLHNNRASALFGRFVELGWLPGLQQ